MRDYTVEEIIKGIRRRDDQILNYLYREYYPLLERYICNNNGTIEDAKEAFQESMVVLYRRLAKEEVRLQAAFKTYFFSICKHYWYDYIEEREIKENTQYIEELEEETGVSDTEAENIKALVVQNEEYRFYQKHYKRLDNECQKVLKLFLKNEPLETIAKKMHYASTNFAKQKKWRCKEILLKRIKDDPKYKKLMSRLAGGC